MSCLLIPFELLFFFLFLLILRFFFIPCFCFYLSFSCCAQFWRIFHSVRFCLVTSLWMAFVRLFYCCIDFAYLFMINSQIDLMRRSGRVDRRILFPVFTPSLSSDYLNVKDKTPVLFEPFSRESFSYSFHCCALSHGFFLNNERSFNFNLLPGNVYVCVVGLRWVADSERNKRVWCVYASHWYRSQKLTHSVDDVIFAKYWLLLLSLSSLWFKHNRTMRNVVLIR